MPSEDEDVYAEGTLDDRLRKLINRRVPARVKKPPTRRKARDEEEVDVTRLSELSHTELVLISQRAGYRDASRQLPREDLIDLILGALDAPEDVLAPYRKAIHTFVTQNEIMVSGMPCDLDCPNCTHHWVVECFADNRDLVEDPE